tara:strand:+ start:2979 stop:3353 length:375 start_codon:yes stop_codon:yes gene_type:complete
MHNGPPLGGPPSRKFAGLGVTQAQQVFGLGNGMHQYYRRQLGQGVHFARKATEAGGLNFVYHPITQNIGNEVAKGYFHLTIRTHVLGFQSRMQRTFVEHTDVSSLSHGSRVALAGYQAPVQGLL